MTALALALLVAVAPASEGGETSAAPPTTLVAQGPAAAAEARRFGDWLLERGDYYRAIGEYQRVLFLDPGGLAAEAASLQAARAYAAGGRADAAVERLRLLAAEAADPAVRHAALFEQGLVRYRAHQAEAAVAPLLAYAGLAPPLGGPGPARARLLLSLARLRAGDDAAARGTLDGWPADGPRPPDADALRLGLDEAAHAPRRSPLLAGLLSAAVPGLGHVYAGDPVAGAGALALNGAFVWATVDAFRHRQVGLGVLLLAGESIWYGGAIFGAVAEAMRFNRDARDLALDGLDRRFSWVVAPTVGGAAVGVRGTIP